MSDSDGGSGKYWRIRDFGPLLVAFAARAIIGVAAIIQGVRSGTWFALVLGVVLTPIAAFCIARILIALRNQRTGRSTMADEYPRDSHFRVLRAIRRVNDIAPDDLAVARKHLDRAVWSPGKFVLPVFVLVFNLAEITVTLKTSNVHAHRSRIVIECFFGALALWLLLRQYRLRRWIRRHPLPVGDGSNSDVAKSDQWSNGFGQCSVGGS
jgi:hypothetical protein